MRGAGKTGVRPKTSEALYCLREPGAAGDSGLLLHHLIEKSTGVIMPISGVVISSRVTEKKEVLNSLAAIAEVEVHGDDEKGNIVAVLETESSEKMEKLIDRINKDPNVLHVGLTYLNTEDEAERMAGGEKLEKPFGFRTPLSGA